LAETSYHDKYVIKDGEGSTKWPALGPQGHIGKTLVLKGSWHLGCQCTKLNCFDVNQN